MTITSRLKKEGYVSRKKIILNDSTQQDFKNTRSFLIFISRHSIHFDSVHNKFDTTAWFGNFKELRDTVFSLRPYFSSSDSIKVMSQTDLHKIGGWSGFYKKFPKYAGIVSLSPVYFDKSRTKAFVCLDLARTKCGTGNRSYHYFKKDDKGIWYAVSNLMAFLQ
ncbi:hypothetical protein [Ferruginibacter albus]|uniref:hypothetical protein n=1 Tax=Ferruginibacter albus TaxID=2875540 RepID=UPI001CC4BBC9|nr:hypothetical protein [Ferruginibacter albus]UAY52415.1 hypothetical protein K9M53_01675 [Ferruginibacter albus]